MRSFCPRRIKLAGRSPLICGVPCSSTPILVKHWHQHLGFGCVSFTPCFRLDKSGYSQRGMYLDYLYLTRMISSLASPHTSTQTLMFNCSGLECKNCSRISTIPSSGCLVKGGNGRGTFRPAGPVAIRTRGTGCHALSARHRARHGNRSLAFKLTALTLMS